MGKKVLLFRFQHETNAICPVPADMTAYKKSCFVLGEDIMKIPRSARVEVTGALNVLEAYPDLEVVPVVNMFANPSGPVTREVYGYVEDLLLQTIREKGPFDGVMALFHGAMVAEGHPDAEGDLLEMLRSQLGWDIPIVSSLDLHANVTEKMARCATALVPFENYPHTDVYDTAYAAAQIFADALYGKAKPVMACRRIPHLMPLYPTERQEIRPLYDLAHQLKSRPGVLSAGFTHGFFAADIEEMGMAVLAVTDGDAALAEESATLLAEAICERKDTLQDDYLPLDAALDMAMEPGDGPVVIADTSDNPGGGGIGNTTHILRRVLERNMTGCAFAVIVDPQSVAACEKAGVGATVQLNLGGWSDPAYSGGPVEVTAYVRMLTDGTYINKGLMAQGATMRMGKTAVLNIQGNTVIVTSYSWQPYDIEVFYSHGINPMDMRLLVVKSSIHYRATFGTVARAMLPIPMPGYIDPRPEKFPFRTWKG
ncbi:MAG: M81 family metallopeptidase [Oscillospiraceae bacterium]|nr:M81 family metallopeptidase [Oscillospiraceae bacterium]